MADVVGDGIRFPYEVCGDSPALRFHTGACGDSRIWGYSGDPPSG